MEICLLSLFHIAFELYESLGRSDNLHQAHLFLRHLWLAERPAQEANTETLEMGEVSESLPKGLEHLEKEHSCSQCILL